LHFLPFIHLSIVFGLNWQNPLGYKQEQVYLGELIFVTPSTEIPCGSKQQKASTAWGLKHTFLYGHTPVQLPPANVKPLQWHSWHITAVGGTQLQPNVLQPTWCSYDCSRIILHFV